MEQPPPPHPPPSPPPHPLPPPPDLNVEVEDKEVVAQFQLTGDERSELEMENSALQKQLIQQVEKYNHDMEEITQVCDKSAPGVGITGVLCLYSCTHHFLS